MVINVAWVEMEILYPMLEIERTVLLFVLGALQINNEVDW